MFGDRPAEVRTLRKRIAVLAEQRDSGRAGRVEGIREWLIAGTPYIAVYRLSSAIEVLRVLDGAQITKG